MRPQEGLQAQLLAPLFRNSSSPTRRPVGLTLKPQLKIFSGPCAYPWGLLWNTVTFFPGGGGPPWRGWGVLGGGSWTLEL